MHDNVLSKESSPYLLQHAHNPVAWMPWGDAAFERAAREEKPIFLSVGYATCHWCHVMAHESFENTAIADYLNAHFIPVKVDREERPDVDAYYMKAVQMMTGRGGWPMSVFLTPDGTPFYGGSYFPPEARYGTPGFLEVLTVIHNTWQEQREDVVKAGQTLIDRIQAINVGGASTAIHARALLENAMQLAASSFDATHGGFSPAPKFPQPTQLKHLLNRHVATGDTAALRMVEHTLKKMADGGIYDQIGGGFHRYSVDAQWLAPHFEKMLYDQAMLLDVYTLAWKIKPNQRYIEIISGIAQFLQREMTAPEGAFYSALDADSEGEEGRFYVWDSNRLKQQLDAESWRILSALYDTSEEGNWEGKLILRRIRDDAEAAAELKLSVHALRLALDALHDRLMRLRERRVRPITDDKILTDWNSLMITALARTGAALERDDVLAMALNAAEFIETRLIEAETLYHSHRIRRSEIEGFLSDYAYWTAALLALYQATGESAWLDKADHWHRLTIQRFGDRTGGFYMESDRGRLPIRQRQASDSPLPSPEGQALQNGWALQALHGNAEAIDMRAPARESAMLNQYPGAMGTFLDFLLQTETGPVTAIITGDKDEHRTRALLNVLKQSPLAGLLIGLGDEKAEAWPLLHGKKHDKSAVFLCARQTCLPPIADPEALAQELRRLTSDAPQ